VFCPNCGTKNDGVELPCKKCGFKLSGAGAPKFRGTMMLNAEQSVQELIDQHRRKQGEEGAADALPANEPGSGPDGSKPVSPRSGAPLFGMPGTPQTVMMPPRAGQPQRRMGTMMGVAPQVGGVQPPEDAPPAGATPAPPGISLRQGSAAAELDPLAGTEAVPLPPIPTSPPGALVAGRTEAFEAVHVAPPPAATAAAMAPDPAWSQATSAAPAAPSPAPRRTEPLDSVAPPRTEPLDSVAPPARRTEPLDSVAPPAQRRRVRPLDVFLIVITFGLYGFVLLARQRRKQPNVD
jgi:hypothetical protein